MTSILVSRHLKTTEDLHDSRPSPRTEALAGSAVQWADHARSRFPICVKNGACSRRCSTAGKKSSSRTEQLLSRRRNVLAASSPARRAWSIPQRMSSNSPVLCESVEIEISTPAAAACRAVSSTSLAKARILLGLNGHPGGWLARLSRRSPQKNWTTPYALQT